MNRVRATVRAAALLGPDAAHQVISEHLRSDAGGRCLSCQEMEPCPQRATAHAALFGHNRQLPRRRPMELIGAGGTFGAGGWPAFSTFGTASGDRPLGSVSRIMNLVR